MVRYRHLAGGAAALVLSAAATACNPSKDLVNPKPPTDALFTSYVALGNSITAGFQSGGINDSTQRQSYAYLLAQMMGTRFAVPSLAAPGCPPPIDNFNTQHRLGGGTPTTCALRSEPGGVAVINDVAVPGANAVDLTSPTGPQDNALTTFVLGGKTEVERALDADPTFATVWIGNNDVLIPALSGVLVPVPGVSAGVTDPATFQTEYAKIIAGLQAAPHLKGGALIGVVDVDNAPIFFHGALLNNPSVIGAIRAATGKNVQVDGSCTPTTPSLIDFRLVGAIALGAAPDTIACQAIAGRSDGLGQLYVLDSAEVQAVHTVVSAYNAYIKAKADSLGWAYFDPNPALTQLEAAGMIPPFPDLTQPTQPYGPFISLDGLHPALQAHQLIAAALADSINAKFGTHIAVPASPLIGR